MQIRSYLAFKAILEIILHLMHISDNLNANQILLVLCLLVTIFCYSLLTNLRYYFRISFSLL